MENDNNVVFRPRLLPGTIVPYPGFPSLKDAPAQALRRRKVGINIFGMRSRYKTAVLEMNSDIPMVASAATLAEKFIGTTLHFRYPFLRDAFSGGYIAVYVIKESGWTKVFSEDLHNNYQKLINYTN